MVQALYAQDGTLLPGLTVQNTYTELRKGSNKAVVVVWNNTAYLGESVTGTEKGLGKETMRFGDSIIFGTFAMDAGRCADEPWQFCCACTVVFPP